MWRLLCAVDCFCAVWNETVLQLFNISYVSESHVVGPCHHGMARPQVVDRGTASDKDDSCE